MKKYKTCQTLFKNKKKNPFDEKNYSEYNRNYISTLVFFIFISNTHFNQAVLSLKIPIFLNLESRRAIWVWNQKFNNLEVPYQCHLVFIKLKIKNFLMKLKLVIVLLSLILPIFYEVHRRTEELDYLHNLPIGSLQLQIQTIPQISSPIDVIRKEDQILFLFKGKKVFRSQNFITLLRSHGSIKSNGDSFYQISDIQQQTCVNQVVTDIQEIDSQLQLKGFFEDCADSGYRLTLYPKEQSVDLIVTLTSRTFNRIKVSFQHSENNYYYGLGEQFSHLILGNNRPYSMFVRQKGVGRTEQPETTLLNLFYGAGGSYYGSYSPAPIWISSQKIGYILDSYAYAAWINNQILVWDRNITINLFFGDSFKEIVSQIAEVNGYTDPIPDWVNEGAILGLQGNTTNVMQKYKAIKQAGGIVKGLWIQDWVNKRQSLGHSRLWWNWQLDTKHYEGWDKMHEQLQEQDVKTLLYMNPMFVNVSTKDTYEKNYYEEGIQNNHFIKLNNGEVFETSAFSDYKAAMMNFDKESGVEFYQNIVKTAIESTNAAGMMVDFSEAYPVQNIHSSIEEAAKFHNEYPVKYHQKVRQAFDSLPNPHHLYSFSRAGYLRAPKYVHSLWAGDQTMNFKKHTGLPSCLTAMISSGLIGYSNTHCDIGGYTFFTILNHPVSSRTQILLERWLQLSAFSPVFRSHEGSAPEKTLQVYSDEQIINDFSFYSKIYASLASYRKQQSLKSQKEKIPLVRPLFLQHDDPEVFKIEDQYYLGDDILVSPLLSPENKRKMYLPQGNWYNLWDGMKMEGCNCYIRSQSFLPPVFIKEGSVHREGIIERIQGIVREFKRIEQVTNQNRSKEL